VREREGEKARERKSEREGGGRKEDVHVALYVREACVHKRKLDDSTHRVCNIM